ncbi:collectrin isoform X3 [Bos taurus]|uniref:collectrin isoform X3 n=1 Tax=Bos taurus TaxID=9913 RepID=UPI0028CB58B5|nr:collectrin isoform X3 [Bos taurus]
MILRCSLSTLTPRTRVSLYSVLATPWIPRTSSSGYTLGRSTPPALPFLAEPDLEKPQRSGRSLRISGGNRPVFLRNLHPAFYSTCNNLHCTWDSFECIGLHGQVTAIHADLCRPDAENAFKVRLSIRTALGDKAYAWDANEEYLFKAMVAFSMRKVPNRETTEITGDGECSHEIKRHLLLGRTAMTNLDSILKSREITFLTKICLIKEFPTSCFAM